MSDAELYSMDELAREAGIAYATLSTFVRKHGNRIPSEKQGRARLFPPRALEVVKEILRENAARQGNKLRRRTPEKAASEEALAFIDRAAEHLRKASEDLDRASDLLIDNPFTVVLSLRTLTPDLAFRQRVDVLVEPDGRECVARLFEVNLCGSGATRQEAMDSLRAVIVETYQELKQTDQERWTAELRERAALVSMLKQRRSSKETP